MTANADLNLASGYANVTNGLVLNATARLGDDAWNYGQLSFQGTQTLSGSGTVILGISGSNSLETSWESTLTIESGITVRGQAGYVGRYGDLINRGTIAADTAGGTIYVGNNSGSGMFTNSGTVRATGGGTLEVDGAWTNAATITATDATLSLGDGAAMPGATPGRSVPRTRR